MLSYRARRTWGVIATTSTLVVAGGGVATAATAKPPKPFRNTTIVVQRSEGGIALGASESTTEKIFGASNCTITTTGGGCGVAGPHNAYTVSASFDAKTKKVDEVIFQSLNFAKSAEAMRTRKNIRIGSTLTQLKKAYSKVKKSRGPGTGRYYSLRSGRTDTQFVLDQKNRLYEIDLFTT